MKESSLKLSVPNDVEFIPLVVDFVSGIASKMHYSDLEKTQISMALEEALHGIIEYAFEVGEEASLDLLINIGLKGLELIIKEKGLPFDPELVPEFLPGKYNVELSDAGLGIFLMKKLMDQYSFKNLGKDGKETRLFKFLPSKAIESIVSKEELEKINKAREAESLPKGSVKYKVRRMRSEEAVDVSKCAYTSYGYTYVHEDVYYPDRLKVLNEKDDVISCIAVTDDGVVISHAALEREDDRMIPQLGIAATAPKYRGQGCLNALNVALIQEAHDRKLMGVFARGITTHVFSQKSLAKMGFKTCALLVSSGLEREYKSIEQKVIQRESVVLMFLDVNPPEKYEVFLPQKHADFIKKIYNYVGYEPLYAIPEKHRKLPEKASVINSKLNHASKTADIFIEEIGKDILVKIKEELTQLCQNRFESVYLQFRLKDEFLPDIINEVEKMNFFPAGIMPHSNNDDVFIMQYLNNHTIDYEGVNVFEDFGNYIKDYVKSFDPNIKS